MGFCKSDLNKAALTFVKRNLNVKYHTKVGEVRCDTSLCISSVLQTRCKTKASLKKKTKLCKYRQVSSELADHVLRQNQSCATKIHLTSHSYLLYRGCKRASSLLKMTGHQGRYNLICNKICSYTQIKGSGISV